MEEKEHNTTILDLGDRWAVSFMPLSLYPRGNSSGNHWIGGWVCPRGSLDALKRKLFCLCQESNLDRPAGSLDAISTPVLTQNAGNGQETEPVPTTTLPVSLRTMLLTLFNLLLGLQSEKLSLNILRDSCRLQLYTIATYYNNEQ
jgi:hypothetical protein